MKSLQRRFNNIAEKNPNLSSYAYFVRTIKGQRFNKQTTHRWFKKKKGLCWHTWTISQTH